MPKATRLPLAKSLGPGLLFAGAAIGVSHLVQSTTAGARFGLSLLLVVLLAHLLKLPALSFGPRYAAATGTSLLEGYRKRGKACLWIVALLTLGTMCTILAAVTVVCAAVLQHVAVDSLWSALVSDPTEAGRSPTLVSFFAVLTLASAILALGGFALLDRAMKVLMLVMLFTTLIATAIALPRLSLADLRPMPIPSEMSAAWLVFVVALVGWMPAPLDISIWNSLWTLTKSRQTEHNPTDAEARADFVIGYALCIVLACAFVVLGASLMHADGIAPATSGSAFVAQLIDLYAQCLGSWCRPIIALAALSVMFSTVLTVLDALPRTLVVLVDRLFSDTAEDPDRVAHAARTRSYWITLAITAAGASAIVLFFMSGFKQLIALATTLSFLSTPVLAVFNHLAITAPEVPEDRRPGRAMRLASLNAIVAFAAFALLYLWTLLSA